MRLALENAATDLGRELAAATTPPDQNLMDHLAGQGFEPYLDGDIIRLRNCPFHQLAQQHTELICGMNLAMLRAATDATDDRFEAHLDPAPDRCCVAFEPRR